MNILCKKKVKFFVIGIIINLLILQNGFADSAKTLLVQQPTKFDLKLYPALQLEFTAGRQRSGKAKFLSPLLGNITNLFYATTHYTQEKDGVWLLNVGPGYRKIMNDRILGGYLLFDCHNSVNGNVFFVAQPGIESLGIDWDFRANAFIPLTQSKILSSAQAEEVGNGANIEIGRAIPYLSKFRLFVGSYYFGYQNAAHAKGVAERLTYKPIKPITLELKHSYDNVKGNSLFVTIRFAFGGISNPDNNALGIAGRMLDQLILGQGDQIKS